MPDMENKEKKPHVSGKFGVELDDLTRLKVLVWVREVFKRLGCDVRKLNHPLSLEEAEKVVEQYPALASGKATQIPKYAEFALYLSGGRGLTEKMVGRIAEAKPSVGPYKGTQPFLYTDEFYLRGPYELDLWKVLENDQKGCEDVAQVELTGMLLSNEDLAKRFLKKSLKSDMRWGLSAEKMLSVFRQALCGLDEGDAPDTRQILIEGVPNVLTVKFEQAVSAGDEESLELWRSYFVTSVALWQIAQEKHESLSDADFILVGMLSGPVESLFVGYGNEIRDYIIDMVLTSVDEGSIKSRKKMLHENLDRVKMEGQVLR